MSQQQGQRSTFQPVHPFDFEDPKTWASTLGNMDWDTTHICFTKRSLLDFLKQAGVTVGTNYTEVQKLPKYATFGKFSKAATDEAVKDLIEAEIADPSHGEQQQQQGNKDDESSSNNNSGGFRPTRKVTQRPGGATSVSIFGGEYDESDALSMAPPKPSGVAGPSAAPPASGEGDDDDNKQDGEPRVIHKEHAEFAGVSFSTDGSEQKFRPTRKVRENPGGRDQMRDILGGYD